MVKTPKKYHIVSLTSILGKIMDSIIKDHLLLKDKNIVLSKQYGFLLERFTVLQLLNTLDQRRKAIGNAGFSSKHFYLKLFFPEDSVSFLFAW